MPERGDLLLYRSPGIIDWIICVKTWSPVAHCEICAGGGRSWASRNRIGVNDYPHRSEGLQAILRPKAPLNWEAGEKWFKETAKGQKYDFVGLMCFYLAAKRGSPDRMFCSEFLTRLYRKLDFDAIHPNWDADKVAPGDFLMTPAFEWIWTNFEP